MLRYLKGVYYRILDYCHTRILKKTEIGMGGKQFYIKQHKNYIYFGPMSSDEKKLFKEKILEERILEFRKMELEERIPADDSLRKVN